MVREFVNSSVEVPKAGYQKISTSSTTEVMIVYTFSTDDYVVNSQEIIAGSNLERKHEEKSVMICIGIFT